MNKAKAVAFVCENEEDFFIPNNSELFDLSSEDNVEVDEEELSHPAELAAQYQSKHSHGPIGGSDDQILKDLRKLVFSIPLLHQKDVKRLFQDIDKRMLPTVYDILQSSGNMFETVIQIIVKVVAGNTYGKNLYERDDVSEPELKGTYKSHEIKFLKNSHSLLKLFAIAESNKVKPKNFKASIEIAMNKCLFIRGVYEEVLHEFVEETKHYHRLHWLAISAKLSGNWEEYNRLVRLITAIDSKLMFDKSGFSISRKAFETYHYYMNVRSKIIAPYLRSVYSVAKSTAKNPHQLLDNFQNGSIGLVRAVSCYSIERPASFASVAKWWIKQMMLLSIKEDANFVKLPVSTWQAYTQLEKAKAKLASKDEEDIDSIAKAAKMSVKKAKSIYDTIKIAQVYSVNRAYDADEKLTLEDIMTNDDRLGSASDELTDLLRDYCHMANLTKEEKQIIALRHGMLDLLKEKSNNQHTKAKLEETLIQNLTALGYNYRIN